jgi:nucleoid-associated protein YgaU
MKHRTIATALLLAGFATPSVSADDGLARCARIAAPTERLDCYDDLANVAGLSEVTAAPVPAAVSVTLEPAPPSEPEAAADAMDAFGFEKKIFREKNENEELVARYVGEFTGWTGGTLFKLDNGQVWKQAQSGRVFHRRDNPQITIRKGALGGFRLSVEGTKRSVRVKRIK